MVLTHNYSNFRKILSNKNWRLPLIFGFEYISGSYLKHFKKYVKKLDVAFMLIYLSSEGELRAVAAMMSYSRTLMCKAFTICRILSLMKTIELNLPKAPK